MNCRELKKAIENSPLKGAVLQGYPFRKGASLLEIAQEPFAERYAPQCIRTAWTDLPDGPGEPCFDYIVCLEEMEKAGDPAGFIRSLLSFLKPDGTLILGADNRFGIRYFCGSKEKHTGIPFLGINGYFDGMEEYLPRQWQRKTPGRSFSRRELEEFLLAAGARNYKFYYPVPDLCMPQMICTDAAIPYGEIRERLNDYDYADPSMLGLEHRLFDEIAAANAFSFLANSFLIEIRPQGPAADAEFVMITADRGKERSAATVLCAGNRVIKRALYPEGEKSLRTLYEHTRELEAAGVPVVPCAIKEDENGLFLEMPRISSEKLSSVLDRIAPSDPETFLRLLDEVYACICRSFREKGNGRGRVFTDLAPCNCFCTEEGLRFFDQEFVSDDSTCAFSMYRALKYFFSSSLRARQAFDLTEVLERYGITPERIPELEEEEQLFLEKVRNRSEYDWLYRISTPDPERIVRNMKKNIPGAEKPYRRGYVPGVFDLFHSGHLRLIERCKERCDYLIVGVLTDELVEHYKGHRPVISYENRAKVIAGLRAVDEVVPVDFENTNQIRAWEQLHFDCHFSGDDHIDDWQPVKEELNRRGSEMEFFSYTEGISSTQIRRALGKEE